MERGKRVRSRQAAQSRRVQENGQFDSLAAVLPLAPAISSQLLDKASIIRLTISCIRLYDFALAGYPQWLPHSYGGDQQLCPDTQWRLGPSILDALDGFLICCAKNWDILYVSETISICLGLSQVDMVGNGIREYIHKDDWTKWLNASNQILCNGSRSHIEICIRMRSTLAKRPNKDVIGNSQGYKVIHLEMSGRGHLGEGGGMGVCGLGIGLPTTATNSIRLDAATFSLTTNFHLTVHYIDPRGEQILNVSGSSDRLNGANLYHLISLEDVHALANLHQNALTMGAALSSHIRLMRTTGDYIYVQMSAIRINKQKVREKREYITFLVTVIGYDS